MLPFALLCAPAVHAAPRSAACRRCHIVAALPSFVSDQKIAAIGEAAFRASADAALLSDCRKCCAGPLRHARQVLRVYGTRAATIRRGAEAAAC